MDFIDQDPIQTPYAFRLSGYLKEEIHRKPQGALAKQFMPRKEELNISQGEISDPIGDKKHSPCPGVVHRYPDRALLMVAMACASYCRYCFRKEVVGRAKPLKPSEIEGALKYISDQVGIREVILTGGDPLVLSSSKLAEWLKALAAIPHIRLIRIHTRVPILDPLRIDETLLKALDLAIGANKSLWMVIHCNHAEELTDPVREAVGKIQRLGVPLLSQSVLLKGVNDDPETLETLFRELLYLGIKPYYLHHLDKAPGSEHFRVSIQRGMEIFKGLRGRLSGLAQPQYVIDIPGGYGKVPVTKDYVSRVGVGEYEITDWRGVKHLYFDSAESTSLDV